MLIRHIIVQTEEQNRHNKVKLLLLCVGVDVCRKTGPLAWTIGIGKEQMIANWTGYLCWRVRSGHKSFRHVSDSPGTKKEERLGRKEYWIHNFGTDTTHGSQNKMWLVRLWTVVK